MSKTLPDIVAELIQENTKLLSDRAIQMVRACVDGIPKELEEIGIILLAVEDAKTQDYPSNTVALYEEAFELAKELIDKSDSPLVIKLDPREVDRHIRLKTDKGMLSGQYFERGANP